MWYGFHPKWMTAGFFIVGQSSASAEPLLAERHGPAWSANSIKNSR
jgi:hypothetical protein